MGQRGADSSTAIPIMHIIPHNMTYTTPRIKADGNTTGNAVAPPIPARRYPLADACPRTQTTVISRLLHLQHLIPVPNTSNTVHMLHWTAHMLHWTANMAHGTAHTPHAIASKSQTQRWH